MTTDNKLLQSILHAGEEQAAVIAAEAQQQADAVAADAAKQADAEEEAILAKAQQQAEGVKKAALSNAALLTRNAVLEAKRREINATVDAMAAHIAALSDEEYFALLYKMAGTVQASEGELLLNARDLARLPKDFNEQLQKVGLNAAVSAEPADIDGGFILRTGAIEQNCSFAAVMEDRRNALEDYINAALFDKGER